MKILIVEDDEGTAEALQQALAAQQYLIEIATDGQAGWNLVETFDYDLILLDVRLPKLNGIQFCQQLRHKGDRTPVLLVTAQDSSTNKVAGLDAGADDYIVKPYDIDELFARIRALLRRGGSSVAPILQWGSLCLDPSNCTVTYDGQLLHCTAREYKLLELFLRNTRRIFSQSALLDRLWSLEEYPTENTVRAHIKSLRQKLKKAGAAADFIETVYGLGYRLQARESDSQTQERTEIQRRGKASGLSTGQNNIPQTPMPSDLTTIWMRNKEKYRQRVAVLEQAITALREGSLQAELQQAAQREAHTLKGSLGSFRLVEGVRLAREIETLLQTESEFNPDQIEHLSRLVEALRQELEKPIVADNVDTSRRSIQQGARLLIVDDDAELELTLRPEAAACGIQVESACDVAQARDAIARARPDVILLDLSFSGSAESGLTLLAELAEVRSPIPVLVFTGVEQFGDRIEVARLGARGFLQKPLPPARVMQEIIQVLDQSSPPDAKLLIVDDDSQLLEFLHGLLEPWGLRLTLLDNPSEFWETLEQTAPDLLILDVEMPDINGIDLCQVVRNDPNWSDLPILFLSAHTDADTIYQVFSAGADDFVNKPIAGPELVARILNRLDRTRILRKLAETDGLTGVTNRRKSIQELSRLLRLAERQNQCLCFMILDLDHFRQINEQYGHDSGDRVLSRLGELLKQNFRSEDVVARWGGEEFVLGLYGIPKEDGAKRLTVVLETLRQEQFVSFNGTLFQVTFSAGVVQYPQQGVDVQTLYNAVDRILYQAKSAGRNQILLG
ncbi:MAG: response regulator [Acaryochloridaceae cyanobacterium RU_4_10]|nr:response regulator [Acaryochloridaceae cyanobacterium RU_4_10]